LQTSLFHKQSIKSLQIFITITENKAPKSHAFIYLLLCYQVYTKTLQTNLTKIFQGLWTWPNLAQL